MCVIMEVTGKIVFVIKPVLSLTVDAVRHTLSLTVTDSKCEVLLMITQRMHQSSP